MVYILTGTVRSGKSIFLKQLVRHLKQASVNVNGYLSVAVHEDNKKIGYDLLVIKTGKSFPFLRLRGDEAWERIGPYFFVASSLKKAEAIIHSRPDSDVLIIDEIGPLELKGKGLWPALKKKLDRSPARLLIVVRKNILHDVVKRINEIDQEVRIFDIQDKNILGAMIDSLSPH